MNGPNTASACALDARLDAGSRAGRPSTFAGWLRRAADTGYLWQRRAADRRTLAEFDEHMLRDVGLDRVDAHQEAAKLFWRA